MTKSEEYRGGYADHSPQRPAITSGEAAHVDETRRRQREWIARWLETTRRWMTDRLDERKSTPSACVGVNAKKLDSSSSKERD